MELILHQDEEPPDDVLDQALGTEADGQARHPGAREQGSDVQPELAQGHHAGNEHHQRDSYGPEEAGQRSGARLPLADPGASPVGRHAQDAIRQHPEQAHNQDTPADDHEEVRSGGHHLEQNPVHLEPREIHLDGDPPMEYPPFSRVSFA